jgi:O-antigen/teichoic acid export membrane protein
VIVAAEKRALLNEGAWVAFGQIAAAFGALAGIRLLTEFLEPGVYGLVVLLLGIAAFGQNLVVTPLMQAVLRFHPESVQTGTIGILRAVSGKTVKYIAVCFAVAASLIGLLYGVATNQPIWFGVLVAGVFGVDSIRSFEVTLLNAARRQRMMAMWTAADAWLKPLAAIAAIIMLGADPVSVLFGYIAGSTVLVALIYSVVEPEGARQEDVRFGEADSELLKRKMWVYVIPLLPVAAACWVSSIGDRYLLAGMLGLREAGIYAATYALVARPFLMISSVAELTVRPIYYHALAARDGAHARAAWRGWLLFSLVVGGAGFVLIWLFKDIVVWLLLAEPYRAGVNLIPWIAAGYWLHVISHVYTRVCYAYHDTKAVLWIEGTGALLAVVVTIPAILSFGIAGAAMAVPVYFGGQLMVAMMLARRAERQSPKVSAGCALQ